MEIIGKKHRRKLSYDDASALDGLGVSAGRIDRSLCREWKEHWDGKAYQWGNSGLGYWRLAANPVLKCPLTYEKPARAGYFDIPAHNELVHKMRSRGGM